MSYYLTGTSIDGRVYWASPGVWTSMKNEAALVSKAEADEALLVRRERNKLCALDDTIGNMDVREWTEADEAAKKRDHRPQWITHATVQLDSDDHDFMGPRVIILKYEQSIVVPTHYAENIPSVGKLIGKLDIEGNGLMEVPLIICKFHTEEEAETIERCMAADDQLLSYARG